MKKIRWLSVSLILMFVLIYLAGCGNTQNATSAQPNAAGTAAPATTASTSPTSPTSPTSSTSKEIVLYTAGGFMPELGYAFTAKTGIKVNYVGDSTGNVLAKVQAERNNPHWDLVWFEGAPSMLNLDRQGMLLQKWTPDSAANLTDVGQKDVPSDKAFYPVFASAAGAIAYNTKLVPADQVPQEWTDLLKPEFKNAVSMNDPNTSGPAYPVIANILSMMGMEKGKQFFLDLKKNGAKFFPDAGSAKNAVSTGAVKVDILQDTSAINLIQSGSPVGLVYPKSGVAFLSSYVAIQKNAPDMDAAKQFVNYLLTPEAQKIMLASTSNAAFFQPVINGVTPRPGRPENIKWNVLDNAWAADNENTIKQWFHDNVVQ